MENLRTWRNGRNARFLLMFLLWRGEEKMGDCPSSEHSDTFRRSCYLQQAVKGSVSPIICQLLEQRTAIVGCLVWVTLLYAPNLNSKCLAYYEVAQKLVTTSSAILVE